MTVEIILALLVLGVAVAVLGTAAVLRGAKLARVSRSLQAPAGSDVEYAAERAASRALAAEAKAELTAGDLASLVCLAGSGILRTNDQRVVVSANTAAHRLLGRPDGRLIGRSVMEVFADHNVEDLVIAAEGASPAERELTLREGARPTVVVRVARAPGGGSWIVLEDVSELRRLQRYRAEFLDNLSHELRTPLTNIRLLADTLERELADLDVEPKVRERVARIDVESGHLAQMVEEVLDLARMEDGTGHLVLAEVDVAALARDPNALVFHRQHDLGSHLHAAQSDGPPCWRELDRIVQ